MYCMMTDTTIQPGTRVMSTREAKLGEWGIVGQVLRIDGTKAVVRREMTKISPHGLATANGHIDYTFEISHLKVW